MVSEKEMKQINEELKSCKNLKFVSVENLGLDIQKTKPKETAEWTYLSLRIKSQAVEAIDQIVSNTMGITRTGWILQAIQEKLQK